MTITSSTNSSGEHIARLPFTRVSPLLIAPSHALAGFGNTIGVVMIFFAFVTMLSRFCCQCECYFSWKLICIIFYGPTTSRTVKLFVYLSTYLRETSALLCSFGIFKCIV